MRVGAKYFLAHILMAKRVEEKLRLLSELETKSIYKEAANVLINEDTYNQR